MCPAAPSSPLTHPQQAPYTYARTCEKGMWLELQATASTKHHQPAPNSAPAKAGPHRRPCSRLQHGSRGRLWWRSMQRGLPLDSTRNWGELKAAQAPGPPPACKALAAGGGGGPAKGRHVGGCNAGPLHALLFACRTYHQSTTTGDTSSSGEAMISQRRCSNKGQSVYSCAGGLAGCPGVPGRRIDARSKKQASLADRSAECSCSCGLPSLPCILITVPTRSNVGRDPVDGNIGPAANVLSGPRQQRGAWRRGSAVPCGGTGGDRR